MNKLLIRDAMIRARDTLATFRDESYIDPNDTEARRRECVVRIMRLERALQELDR